MKVSSEERLLRLLLAANVELLSERYEIASRITELDSVNDKKEAVESILYSVPAYRRASPRWEYLRIMLRTFEPELQAMYTEVIDKFTYAWKAGKIKKQI